MIEFCASCVGSKFHHEISLLIDKEKVISMNSNLVNYARILVFLFVCCLFVTVDAVPVSRSRIMNGSYKATTGGEVI